MDAAFVTASVELLQASLLLTPLIGFVSNEFTAVYVFSGASDSSQGSPPGNSQGAGMLTMLQVAMLQGSTWMLPTSGCNISCKVSTITIPRLYVRPMLCLWLYLWVAGFMFGHTIRPQTHESVNCD